MSHWAATNLETGEVRFVTDRNYDLAKWSLAKLPRVPGEHDRFENGKLVRDETQRERTEHESFSQGLSRSELVLMILDLQARVYKLESPK